MERVKVVIDANIFITFIEVNYEFSHIIKKFFEKLFDEVSTIVVPTIVLTEVLAKPIQDKNKILEERYLGLFNSFENFQFIDIGVELAIKAAEIRGKYKIRTPNAIYLGTAEIANADFLITLDKELKIFDKVKVLTPSEYLAQ